MSALVGVLECYAQLGRVTSANVPPLLSASAFARSMAAAFCMFTQILGKPMPRREAVLLSAPENPAFAAGQVDLADFQRVYDVNACALTSQHAGQSSKQAASPTI